MKVSELYEQVSKLGFEDSLEDGKGFYHSANRALLQVGAIRPAKSACVITCNPLTNLLGDNFFPIEKRSGEVLVFEATGAKAFYFECDGDGEYIVECLDGNTWKKIGDGTLKCQGRDFSPYRGVIRDGSKFVQGQVKITFLGQFLYHLRGVAMYAELYSDKADDIPEYAPFHSYDLNVLTDDFLTFASPISEIGGGVEKKYDGYQIEGNCILIPHEYSGTVRIPYNRKRRKIEYKTDAASDETDIDLDEELCSLLPLLVASYVWLEDEEGKAAYYMNLYRERAAEIERRQRNYNPSSIKNVYGW